MAKAFNIVVEGREFECYASPIGYGMVSVSFWEVVNPTRKFFRTKWRDSGVFWVDDFDTIQKGVESCIQNYINTHRKEQERFDKWEEFEKSLK